MIERSLYFHARRMTQRMNTYDSIDERQTTAGSLTCIDYGCRLGLSSALLDIQHSLDSTPTAHSPSICHGVESHHLVLVHGTVDAPTTTAAQQDRLPQGSAQDSQCKGQQVVRVDPVLVISCSGRLCRLSGLPSFFSRRLTTRIGIIDPHLI
jgi:hypothetical protein